jgi:hypothetical protein
MVRVKVFDRFGCPVPAEQTAIDLALIRFSDTRRKADTIVAMAKERRHLRAIPLDSTTTEKLLDSFMDSLSAGQKRTMDSVAPGPEQIRVQTLRSTLSKQLSGLAVKDRLRAKAMGMDVGEAGPPNGPAEETAYMKACRAEDVPMPPQWPDDSWTNQGELPSSGSHPCTNSQRRPRRRADADRQ